MSSRVFENEKLQIASDHSKICSKRFLIIIPKIMELLKKCKLIKKKTISMNGYTMSTKIYEQNKMVTEACKKHTNAFIYSAI